MTKNLYFRNLLYILMGLFVFIPIIGSIMKSGIDSDSVYYICIAERIVDGYVPYTDLRVIYTPLWFYIEALCKIIFHIPHGMYWPYLMLTFIFQIVNAYLLYRLICKLNIKKTIALFAAWLYLLMSHWLEGNVVLIEIPSVTFCLLSCWLVLQYKDKNPWHYIWIGIIAACSFLVKQYGLGTFALCLYLMFFVAKCDWKQSVAFVGGYILPIVLCLILWRGAFVEQVLMNGYGSELAIKAGYDVSLSTKLSKIAINLNWFCYMVCPLVYVGWLFGRMAWRQGRIGQLIFTYCGIFGFALVFYFTGGQKHYHQYLLPFAILLMVELMHLTRNSNYKFVVYAMVGWVILVSSYKTYHNCVYKLYIKGTQKESQIALSKTIGQYVKEGETIYVVHESLGTVYLLNNILPPNLSTINYLNAPLTTDVSMSLKQIQSADWVLRYSQDYPYYWFFTDSLKHYVEQYPAINLGDSTILLHKMHEY